MYFFYFLIHLLKIQTGNVIQLNFLVTLDHVFWTICSLMFAVFLFIFLFLLFSYMFMDVYIYIQKSRTYEDVHLQLNSIYNFSNSKTSTGYKKVLR